MAKLLSPVFSIIRGSIGGITYSANQFHQIIARSKTSPVNPNTGKQSAIRSAFSSASNLWKDASSAVRQGWVDYASTLTFTGPLGSYSVPGRDVFIANLTVANYLSGQTGEPASVLTTPPVIAGFLDVENVIEAVFAPAGATGVSYTYTYNGSEDIIGYASRSFGFDPSRNRFKGPFLSNTLGISELASPGTAIVNFEGLTEDARYFMNPRFITAEAPFRLSARFYLDAIAVTNV